MGEASLPPRCTAEEDVGQRGDKLCTPGTHRTESDHVSPPLAAGIQKATVEVSRVDMQTHFSHGLLPRFLLSIHPLLPQRHF